MLRPPTDLHPERASRDQLWTIQLKGGNGGAMIGGWADDFRSILTPEEMIEPFLPSRVPQPQPPSRVGLPPRILRSLEFIARIARHP